MSLTTPQSVRKLQRALYAKAKANPASRFYALYDKIWRKDSGTPGDAAVRTAEGLGWMEKAMLMIS